MLISQPATSDQIEAFIHLLQSDAADYLERAMELRHMTWPQFTQIARTVGQVFSVYRHDERVGFYWIEERESILHLHGIVVERAYRQQGIGTEILRMLEQKYAGVMEAIELGVHKSNTRARALYARLGYGEVKYLPDVGFYILRRPLAQNQNDTP